MKRIITALVIGLSLLLGTASADYQAGYTAYERGDYNSAMEILLPLAEEEDANAQYYVAKIYLNYDKIFYNIDRGINLMIKSANNGNTEATYEIGVIYFSRVRFQNYEKAFHYLVKAAKNKHASAMLYLGNMYSGGYFVEKNLEKAKEWYLQSIRGGEGLGALGFAYQYLWGEGVRESRLKWYMWLTVGSELGAPDVDYLMEREEKLSWDEKARADKMARICIKNNYNGC